MSRIFIWLESSSTLNFDSERDPDEMVQTHMLSWAFADHICHKYQQGLYQLIWDPSCAQENSTRIEW